jgi:uncharacterized membrane protein
LRRAKGNDRSRGPDRRGSGPSPSRTISDDVRTVAALRERVKEGVDPHQRWVERLTNRLGSPGAVYVIVAMTAVWIAFNLLAPRLGLGAVDPPPFVWLQGFTAVAALLVTTMVLTTQNRLARDADRRGHLELKVNLLAEQKATKIIALLEELRRDMPGVRHRSDREAEALAQPVDPHRVMSALEKVGNANDLDDAIEKRGADRGHRS